VGEPVALADGVATDARLNAPAISVAPGLVAYRSGDGNMRQLTWVDRSGTPRGVVGPRDSTLSNPSVSPDGQRVAVARAAQGISNIWLFDGLREGRLTAEPRVDRFPVWSADGATVVFSRVEAAINLYQKRRNGSGAAEPVLASDESKVATSASRDGRLVFYNSVSNATNVDIWVAPWTGDRAPAVWLKTPFREGYAMFSPDGRWVAYQSNESGRPEIYVRPFAQPSPQASAFASATADTSADRAGTRHASGAEPDGQWQVSTNGGIHPVWRHDGKELFYLSPAGEMMAAPITATAGGVAPGAPAALFQTRVVGGGIDALQARQYDVAPDGRFLINTALEDGGAPITIIQHWNPEAKK
jgi:Tol biopolymer transport system component